MSNHKGINIKKKYKPGQAIKVTNPRSGKKERGKITSYAFNNIGTRHPSPTGIMVKFSSTDHPVEIDGAFL